MAHVIQIRFLGDPSAAFTKALELDFDGTAVFGGPRSKRYALKIENGRVAAAHVEPDGTGYKGKSRQWLEIVLQANGYCSLHGREGPCLRTNQANIGKEHSVRFDGDVPTEGCRAINTTGVTPGTVQSLNDNPLDVLVYTSTSFYSVESI